jgi:hypothetical protein
LLIICDVWIFLQAHFLLAGTLEGSLHLWDLREDSSLHKDR